MRSVIGYVVIGISAAIALIGLSFLALWRTRREQAALAEASQAVARRAALEMQLHRAQRLEAVGLLTAGIAHDFNNLLTIVAGNVERLEATLDEDDSRRQKMLTAAQDACTRATALSKRLLGFARHEPANPRSIDINEIIVNTLELPWKTGDRIRGEFRLSDDLWQVHVDPDQLATALLNLAFNARDAMPRGGRLLVETTISCSTTRTTPRPSGLRPALMPASLSPTPGTGCQRKKSVRRHARPVFHDQGPRQGNRAGHWRWSTRSPAAQVGAARSRANPGKARRSRFICPGIKGGTRLKTRKAAAIPDRLTPRPQPTRTAFGRA